MATPGQAMPPPRSKAPSASVVQKALVAHMRNGGSEEAFKRAAEACAKRLCVPTVDILTFKGWQNYGAGPAKGERGTRIGPFTIVFCRHQVVEYDH